MGVLDGLMKKVDNPYASIAKDGIICGDISGYVDTGIYTLNALISGKFKEGGFPKGKVTALAGEKGTGKTYVLLNALQKYLEHNKKANVVFFESEGAITKDMLIERDIDVSRVSIFPVSTVEEFRHQVLVTLDYFIEIWEKTGERPEITLCLDSLGMLGTNFEVETSRTNSNKADMGKRAQLIKSVFRNITLKLSLLQIPMVITNHTYKGMGQYDPTKMGGGQGLEFAASIIIFLSKSKIKDSNSLKTLVGNLITFHVHKGRLTMEGSSAKIELDFKEGIKKYNGILPLLIESKIFSKKGAWIAYNGENIAQGDKKFYEGVDNFMNDGILDELVPYIEEKFMYGKHNTQEVE